MVQLLLLAAAAASVGSAPAKAPPTGGELVFQRCYACHSVDPKETGLPGPNLAGVVGRKAASLPGFDYSEAMIRARDKANWVWTVDALGYFLTNPQAVIPHNQM